MGKVEIAGYSVTVARVVRDDLAWVQIPIARQNKNNIILIMAKNNLRELREFEASINKNLYILCAILTVVTMSTILIEFFSRGEFPNLKIDIFYLGILFIYSLHKELIRLMGKNNINHHGEYFVYAWIILTVILYLINFATKDYFTASPTNQQNAVLSDASLITLEIMVVFIITRCIKIIRSTFVIKEE